MRAVDSGLSTTLELSLNEVLPLVFVGKSESSSSHQGNEDIVRIDTGSSELVEFRAGCGSCWNGWSSGSCWGGRSGGGCRSVGSANRGLTSAGPALLDLAADTTS